MRFDISTRKEQRDKQDVLAYENAAGVIVLNPIYFDTAWVDNNGWVRTGCIDCGIYPPLGPEKGADLDAIWDPVHAELEKCFFSGDKLTLIL